jgi:hypothetical protein
VKPQILIIPRTGLVLVASSGWFLSCFGFPVSGSFGSFNQTTFPWYFSPFL